jgi:membrane-bound ClpP family serine protease
MNGRLIVAVVTTLLEEGVIIFLLVWGLPKLGLALPLLVIIGIGLLWTGFAVLMYVSGSRALRKKPTGGLTDMVGSTGTVVKTLSPAGMVKISGELWAAKSMQGNVPIGEEVTVINQAGLTLFVRKSSG